jgi:putative hydrolase of the HAD superfamily
VLLDDPGLDAVLFDAGGVLILPDPEHIRLALTPLGATPDDDTCRRAHYEGMRECDRIGGPKWPLVDRVIGRIAGVAEERLDDVCGPIESVYLSHHWVEAPGATLTLHALSAAGIPLAVVSNASGTMEQLLAELGVCGVSQGPGAKVAVVVDSEVVGFEKPDPRIFETALRALGLPAERCAFVGDTVTFDVLGAKAAGLRPYHLDPYELCPDDDHGHLRALEQLIPTSAG